MKGSPVILLAVLVTDTCLAQSALNVSRLHDDLPTWNPNVRPAHDVTQPTEVNVTFHLNAIISLDTASQKLISSCWMSVSWQNHFMTWDPQDYGGIQYISAPVAQMWRPRLTVLNSLEELKPVGEDHVVLNLFFNGLMVWYPAERFETFCQIDVTFFPFDTQRCTWQLFSWAEDVNEVLLRSTLPYIDEDTYRESGEWELVTSSAWEYSRMAGSGEFCMLHFEVILRRRPTVLILTVLVPVMVLSVTNVFVFTIPSEAGERLAYSMTSLLSFGVFMSFIVDLMPSTSETVSIMAANLSCQLISSALFVLLCILSLRFFHRDPRKHPVSPTIQSLVIALETLMNLDPPTHSVTPFSQYQEEMTSSGSSSESFGTEVKGSRLKGHLDRWAMKRLKKPEAYTRPQDMTWQRVSRTLDKLFFRFFSFLGLTINFVVLTVMIVHYYKHSSMDSSVPSVQ